MSAQGALDLGRGLRVLPRQLDREPGEPRLAVLDREDAAPDQFIERPAVENLFEFRLVAEDERVESRAERLALVVGLHEIPHVLHRRLEGVGVHEAAVVEADQPARRLELRDRGLDLVRRRLGFLGELLEVDAFPSHLLQRELERSEPVGDRRLLLDEAHEVFVAERAELPVGRVQDAAPADRVGRRLQPDDVRVSRGHDHRFVEPELHVALLPGLEDFLVEQHDAAVRLARADMELDGRQVAKRSRDVGHVLEARLDEDGRFEVAGRGGDHPARHLLVVDVADGHRRTVAARISVTSDL